MAARSPGDPHDVRLVGRGLERRGPARQRRCDKDRRLHERVARAAAIRSRGVRAARRAAVGVPHRHGLHRARDRASSQPRDAVRAPPAIRAQDRLRGHGSRAVRGRPGAGDRPHPVHVRRPALLPGHRRGAGDQGPRSSHADLLGDPRSLHPAGGGRAPAASRCAAASSRRASSPHGASSCSPTGRPAASPTGTEMPGTPARFASVA